RPARNSGTSLRRRTRAGQSCCPVPRSPSRCRQYCPPTRAPWSISTTRAPARPAATAAASPAGPAPMTAISAFDVIAGPRFGQACPLVGLPVDGDETVEADPDPAKNPARLAAMPGDPPCAIAGRDQRRTDALPGLGRDFLALKGEAHGCPSATLRVVAGLAAAV